MIFHGESEQCQNLSFKKKKNYQRHLWGAGTSKRLRTKIAAIIVWRVRARSFLFFWKKKAEKQEKVYALKKNKILEPRSTSNRLWVVRKKKEMRKKKRNEEKKKKEACKRDQKTQNVTPKTIHDPGRMEKRERELMGFSFSRRSSLLIIRANFLVLLPFPPQFRRPISYKLDRVSSVNFSSPPTISPSKANGDVGNDYDASYQPPPPQMHYKK